MTLAYHFVGKTLRDGSPVPPDGEWLEFKGEPILCEQGLHASKHPRDALTYAPGFTLCIVELGGKIVCRDDKMVATKRKILKRIDAKDLLFDFSMICALRAADHAESVLHIFEKKFPNDNRPRKAIEAARRVFDKKDAAAYAAYAAADAAADAADAVYAAARAAYAAADAAADAADAVYAADAAARAARVADAAETKWQRDEFKRLVDEAFANA